MYIYQQCIYAHVGLFYGKYNLSAASDEKRETERHYGGFETPTDQTQKPPATLHEQNLKHNTAHETLSLATKAVRSRRHDDSRKHPRVCRRNIPRKKENARPQIMLRHPKLLAVQSSEYHGCILHTHHDTECQQLYTRFQYEYSE